MRGALVVVVVVSGCFAPEVRRFDEGATDGSVMGGTAEAVSVSVHGNFGCAALANGTVRCWGPNTMGQLGVAPATRTFAPRPIEVAGLSSIVQVAVGADFACALSGTGEVRCWGSTYADGDGDESTPFHPEPVRVTVPPLRKIVATYGGVCGIANMYGLWCWYDRRTVAIAGVGATPVAVPNLETATEVSLFDMSGCAVQLGYVYCWGSQVGGHLGDGMDNATTQPTPTLVPSLGSIAQVAVGDRTSCARSLLGGVTCWGAGALVGGGPAPDTCTAGASASYPCQLVPADVPGLSGVSGLAAGAYSFCALKSDNTIACWGDDMSGALGTGTPVMQSTPTPMMVVADASALIPNIASPTTCMLREQGALWCTGEITGYESMNMAVSSTVPVAWAW